MFDTIRSYVQSNVTDTQRHHVVDLLYECVLIRDGLALLPRFLKFDLQTIVTVTVYAPHCDCHALVFSLFVCFFFFLVCFSLFLHLPFV